MKPVMCFLCFCLLQPFFQAWAGPSEREREKLGLSQEDWQACQALNLSIKQIRKLLAAGITPMEYASQPWYELGISKKEWLRLRHKGWSDEDIKMSQIKQEVGQGLVVATFFLPGYGQCKMGQKKKAVLMAGVAVASLTLFALVPKKITTSMNEIEYQPNGVYLGLLFVDCLASAGDVWRQTRFKDNPDSERFSLSPHPDLPIGLQGCLRF